VDGVSYYTDPLVTLLHGDCIEVMAGLEADSVDAVVTDPPYNLEFMGKDWDKFGAVIEHPADGEGPWGRTKRVRYGRSTQGFQAWCEQWGREALRVTKPGGYLLAFGGTRTHHRLVCALEDAGWIIRDELDWIYASGFPKGKANLKPAHEPIVLARKPGPLRPLGIDASRIAYPSGAPESGWSKTGADRSEGFLGTGTFKDRVHSAEEIQERVAAGRWPSNVLLSDPELFDSANPYVVGSGATTQGSTPIERPDGFQRFDGTDYNGGKPYTTEAYTSTGYGDAGGYSRFFRIPAGDDASLRDVLNRAANEGRNLDPDASDDEAAAIEQWAMDALADLDAAPYPRHLIIPKADRAERERGLAGGTERGVYNGGEGMGGRSLRDGEWVNTENPRTARANVHPTVKPIDLMRHLVRLVTPVDGVVLDPFLGSGTTCLAASEEGFRSIGIEQSAEYLEIAKGRLMATPMGFGLDTPITGKKPPKTHPDLAKHQPKRRAAGENWSGRWAGSQEPTFESVFRDSLDPGAIEILEGLTDDEEPAA
jgi:DNA modification methylase